MKSHRFHYVIEPLEKFIRELNPSARFLFWSAQLIIVASLLLFQLWILVSG